MFFRYLAGCTLVLVAFSSPAFAGQVTPEGAEQLKSLIQNHLDLRQKVEQAMGNEMIVTGKLSVEPAGAYYKVIFPHLSEKYSDGKIFDMGNLALNAMPGATDKEWKVSFSIPAPLYMKDAGGKLLWQVDMGNQKASGVWNADLQSFTKLNADYKDVKLVVNESSSSMPAEIKLAAVTVGTDLTLGSNGFYSGSGNAALSGLSSVTEDVDVKIGRIGVDSMVKDFDPKIVQQVTEQVSAIGESGGSFIDVNSSQKNGLAIFNMVTDVLGKSSDGFDSTFSIEDLSVSGKKEGGDPLSFSLGKAQIGFKTADFHSGLVKIGLSFGYEKAVSSGIPAYLETLVPAQFSTDLSFNNLPYAKLVDLGRSAVAADPNKTPQGSSLSVVTQIPQILTESGANLTQKTSATAPSYTVKSEGTLKANSKAIKGFTAEQNMEINGLDVLIAQLTEQGKIPNNPSGADIQSMLGVLTMLQMTGQQKPDAPSVRTYRLTLDELGQTLLNGSDLSAFAKGK